jgi:hypothetical protein
MDFLTLSSLCSFRWGHLIDFTKFHLAGGCVLTSLLVNATVFDGQDCDLFYKGADKEDFLTSVVSLTLKMLFCIMTVVTCSR